MSTLLERMKSLMDQNGIKPSQMTTILGISNSSFTDWGKGKGTPSVVALTKFADYFNVSLDYLVRGYEFHSSSLEFSNSFDQELIDKFHSLSPEYQQKLLGYADGMLTILQSVEKDTKPKD